MLKLNSTAVCAYLSTYYREHEVTVKYWRDESFQSENFSMKCRQFEFVIRFFDLDLIGVKCPNTHIMQTLLNAFENHMLPRLRDDDADDSDYEVWKQQNKFSFAPGTPNVSIPLNTFIWGDIRSSQSIPTPSSPFINWWTK